MGVQYEKEIQHSGVNHRLSINVFHFTGCSSNSDDYDDESAYEDEYEDEDIEREEASYIPYDDAINHIGSDSPYGGYVVSWSSPGVNGDPLFINIGAGYPDKSRLTVVIWGENRDDTTEDIVDSLLGKEVVVFGSPYEYNGAAQIEIMDPSELLTYEEFIDAYENQ